MLIIKTFLTEPGRPANYLSPVKEIISREYLGICIVSGDGVPNVGCTAVERFDFDSETLPLLFLFSSKAQNTPHLFQVPIPAPLTLPHRCFVLSGFFLYAGVSPGAFIPPFFTCSVFYVFCSLVHRSGCFDDFPGPVFFLHRGMVGPGE